MKCVVNWIPLRIRVRSRNTQPHLNINNVYKSKLNLLRLICVLFYSSFVCMSAYANVYFKTICECKRQKIFMCLRSIAGVPFDSDRRFRATLLLRTTCMRLWGNWVASCVLVLQTKYQNSACLHRCMYMARTHNTHIHTPHNDEFSTWLFFNQISLKVAQKHPELLGRISTSDLDPHFFCFV